MEGYQGGKWTFNYEMPLGDSPFCQHRIKLAKLLFWFATNCYFEKCLDSIFWFSLRNVTSINWCYSKRQYFIQEHWSGLGNRRFLEMFKNCCVHMDFVGFFKLSKLNCFWYFCQCVVLFWQNQVPPCKWSLLLLFLLLLLKSERY